MNQKRKSAAFAISLALLVSVIVILPMVHRDLADDAQQVTRATALDRGADSSEASDGGTGIEKPVSTTVSEARELLARAASSTTRAKTTTSPVPASLDLTRIPRAEQKGGTPPVLAIPSPESLEKLFDHKAGDSVEVKFTEELSFVGKVLWNMPQAGTSVRAVAASNEDSTLHLERSRRGSYRGSIIHKKSATAHRLETRGDGTFTIEQIPFNELVCALDGATPDIGGGLPSEIVRDPGEQVAESGPAEAPVPAFESHPGATAVIYLDFDGQVVTGTQWNTLRNIATIDAA
jgi:hypothetical protein